MNGQKGNLPAHRLIFNRLTVENGLSQNTIHGIVKDTFGFIWFGTWEGVNRFDGYSFKIYRTDINDSNSIANNRIDKLCLDSKGNIWVLSGESAVCRYNYDRDNFTRISSQQFPHDVWDILNRTSSPKPGDATIDFDRISNIIRITQNGNSKIYFCQCPDSNTSLNDIHITGSLLDNTGILWIGTENNGIMFADTYGKSIEYYNKTPDNSYSLAGNIIRAITEDAAGNIWVGTQNNGITVIPADGSPFKQFSYNGSENSLISNEIRSIYCDSKGFIWIGTKNGLSKYYPQTKKFTGYSVAGSRKIPDNSVFCITEDHTNTVWIGTFNGIARYNPQNEEFVPVNQPHLLKSNKIRYIKEDHLHQLWIATEGGGLSVLKRSPAGSSDILQPLKNFITEGNNRSIPSNTILALAEDEDGMIWAGTNNGLCNINTSTLELSIPQILDFPDKLIMGIISDKKGFVWISHKKGLTRLNIHNYNIRNYNKTDGLQGPEFAQNACYISRKQKIYFGGINGLNAFYTSGFNENTFLPLVRIIGLKINSRPVSIGQLISGRKVLPKSILCTGKIELPASVNSLDIEFTAIHYSNASENKYSYKLEGFDKEWTITDANRRVASYSKLPPGKYLFKVKASNCDNIWSGTPALLEITVIPEWWQSQVAIIAYFSGFLIFALLLLRNQFKNSNPSNLDVSRNSSVIDPGNAIVQDEFIEKAISIIKENLSDIDFDIDKLSRILNISQRQLYRKIQTATNLTVHDFITGIRIDAAKDLLKNGTFTISEIAYKVGYTEPANFTRTFTRKTGKSPSAYLKHLKNIQ